MNFLMNILPLPTVMFIFQASFVEQKTETVKSFNDSNQLAQ